jgi:hypothetical protein
MWPFKNKPDNRPATQFAVAIAKSLRDEPRRWKIHGQYGDYLLHDSGVLIDGGGWVRHPDIDDEPAANGDLVDAAIQEWIAKMVSLPVPEAVEVQAKVEEAQ